MSKTELLPHYIHQRSNHLVAEIRLVNVRVVTENLVYHQTHLECNEPECDIRAAYIRVDNKWTKIGRYNTGCKTFEPLDPIAEDKQRKFEEKLEESRLEIKEIRKKTTEGIKKFRDELENTHFSDLASWIFDKK